MATFFLDTLSSPIDKFVQCAGEGLPVFFYDACTLELPEDCTSLGGLLNFIEFSRDEYLEIVNAYFDANGNVSATMEGITVDLVADYPWKEGRDYWPCGELIPEGPCGEAYFVCFVCDAAGAPECDFPNLLFCDIPVLEFTEKTPVQYTTYTDCFMGIAANATLTDYVTPGDEILIVDLCEEGYCSANSYDDCDCTAVISYMSAGYRVSVRASIGGYTHLSHFFLDTDDWRTASTVYVAGGVGAQLETSCFYTLFDNGWSANSRSFSATYILGRDIGWVPGARDCTCQLVFDIGSKKIKKDIDSFCKWWGNPNCDETGSALIANGSGVQDVIVTFKMEN